MTGKNRTNIKKQKTPNKFGVFFVLKYLFVTSAGFEPATNGAEIRHSIQLNYEAVYLDDRLLDF